MERFIFQALADKAGGGNGPPLFGKGNGKGFGKQDAPKKDIGGREETTSSTNVGNRAGRFDDFKVFKCNGRGGELFLNKIPFNLAEVVRDLGGVEKLKTKDPVHTPVNLPAIAQKELAREVHELLHAPETVNRDYANVTLRGFTKIVESLTEGGTFLEKPNDDRLSHTRDIDWGLSTECVEVAQLREIEHDKLAAATRKYETSGSDVGKVSSGSEQGDNPGEQRRYKKAEAKRRAINKLKTDESATKAALKKKDERQRELTGRPESAAVEKSMGALVELAVACKDEKVDSVRREWATGKLEEMGCDEPDDDDENEKPKGKRGKCKNLKESHSTDDDGNKLFESRRQQTVDVEATKTLLESPTQKPNAQPAAIEKKEEGREREETFTHAAFTIIRGKSLAAMNGAELEGAREEYAGTVRKTAGVVQSLKNKAPDDGWEMTARSNGERARSFMSRLKSWAELKTVILPAFFLRENLSVEQARQHMVAKTEEITSAAGKEMKIFIMAWGDAVGRENIGVGLMHERILPLPFSLSIPSSSDTLEKAHLGRV